ncbi:MAG: hypothetical protein H6774_01225 [Pseudomonadales bacterium]|nr:hypothetical protein [Candidatus Woesebacteria bacterium]MCB9801688.1 hypothetical protein [Pseudomonadales bacterium]
MPSSKKDPLTLNKPNPLLLPIAFVFSFFVFALGGLIFSASNESIPTALPIASQAPATAEEIQNTACSTENSGDLQTCCTAWAEEQSITRVQCVGAWSLDNNGQCAWRCGG